jgi:glycosyltransferase involved in cell wall biosynthesis
VRLEAVITCVNYADFLAHSLPENLQHLDHVVVVTDRKDKATKDLCNYLGVVCIDTDVFTEHGDKFNKGRGINLGLCHCRHDDWLIHLDADIVLPHRFRYLLNAAKPEQDSIYGADRLYVQDFAQWQSFDKTRPQWQDSCHVIPHPNFKMGSRILHGDYGYCPIGYFQLWHASQYRQYGGSAGSSEHSDVLFSLQWPRVKRVLLPQMFVHHLASEDAPMGANWEGRKTKAFCPCHSHTLPKELAYQNPQKPQLSAAAPVVEKHHHPHPYHPHHHHHGHKK